MFLESFFEKAVGLNPDAIAIEHGNLKYSYQEVNNKANQLAHYLQTRNVTPEEKVIILLPRCGFVPIAMLGVLKAGAAYIPLDPEIPADRVNFIMEDSGAKLIITSNEILQRIGNQLNENPIFNIDNQLTEINKLPLTKPAEIDRCLTICVT